MRNSKKSMTGVSLIEALLVLAIGAAIIAMGLKLYQGFNTDLNAQGVKYNAEEIMRAAAMYYYANCENMPGTRTATLDPSNNPKNPTPVTITNLVNSGYLMKAPEQNPIVNSSAVNGGYYVQFNRMPDSTRYFCTTYGCKPIGTSVNWQIQVAVVLNTPSAAKRYLGMTGADCLTRASFGGTVQTCSAAASSKFNYYLSWQRLPSMVSPKGQSPLWMTNPVIKQFKQYFEEPPLSQMLANPTTVFKCGS